MRNCIAYKASQSTTSSPSPSSGCSMMCNVSWSGVNYLRSNTTHMHGSVSFGPFQISVSSARLTVLYNSNVIYSGTITDTSVNINNDAVTANASYSISTSYRYEDLCSFYEGYTIIIDFYVTVNVSVSNCSGGSYSSSIVKPCNGSSSSFTLLDGYAFTSVSFLISQCEPITSPCP